jgi:hypothetical protein
MEVAVVECVCQVTAAKRSSATSVWTTLIDSLLLLLIRNSLNG